VSTAISSTDGFVTGVNGSIVTIEVPDGDFMKNEVAYVSLGGARLKSEVLRVEGRRADLQVFEDTEGIAVGDRVELTGELLSATLGPGLLGTVYDGLQNPLEQLAQVDGFFLKRGHELAPLDPEARWEFTPACRVGAKVRAGDCLGTVPERAIQHKIMVPFDEPGELEVVSIASGSARVDEPIATVRDRSGRERTLTMSQRWPVRRPLPEPLLRRGFAERRFPNELLTTSIRIIDTFFPIAKGGTACIPGPFGAGKTVLQSLIARYSAADIVIVVACGERAGEVLETLVEFKELVDPRSGRPLMDRTLIICNTSSMPVPAREASIYMGITLGEYYRQMGLDVLLLADSTSRWAQAMRETSGRLEEIPGEEAYPAYLDSAIKGVYERAGVIGAGDESGAGSLTVVGTVSPAGGNFEEPVTQSTLGTVKTFLGLSYDRAYKRFYPAIDPLISWSRYLDQLRDALDRDVAAGWADSVARIQSLFEKGDEIYRMMQVTGEEGVSLDDYVLYQKALLVDMVYLQQDAFDEVDVSTPLERQKLSFELVRRFTDRSYRFDDKEQARGFFTRVTNAFKNLNYSELDSGAFRSFLTELERLADEHH
jgi:V/A-type H+-transporting ATPase subunit A